MKTKVLLTVAALLALGLAAACTRSRTDAQIAGDVQSKVNADPQAQSRCLVQGQCTVQVSNGVVTLNGAVPSDAERAALANDAAQVEGVKTVVNNLQVASSQVASAAPAPEPPAPEPVKEDAKPAPAPRHERAAKSKPSGFTPGVRRPNTYNETSTATAPVTTASDYSASRVVNTPPPLPPKPLELTVPEGTQLSIRLIDPIDSEKNQTGDHFRATLDAPVVINDKVAIPAGADIYGRITNAKSAAHFAGRSELALELTRVSVNGKSYELHTDQFSKQGTARGKNTAEKVGAGAALGAIIGGIAGGGKGAAIGATVGAGAGGTAQAVTKGQQIKLTSEQVLAFHLESPLTVTPTSRLDRDTNRQKLDVNE